MSTAIRTDITSPPIPPPPSRRTLMAMIAATVVMTTITTPLAAAVTPGAVPFRIRDEEEAFFLSAYRTLTPPQRVALADWMQGIVDGTRDRNLSIRFAKALGHDDQVAEAFADRVEREYP